ncbi:MAG: response regulator transcription factor [Marinilabiliaceae bacterium]|nr:response regulator transcription factor [Marinilabiliaceae bacterium]
MKILIVEDNIFFQKVLMEIVSIHFPDMTILGPSASVSSSIELIKKTIPDIILMDIHLTDGTAFEVLKQVDSSAFKIIFITAYHEYMLEALRFSSVDFVFKPFDSNEIVLAVDKMVHEINHIDSTLPNQQLINTLILNVESDDNDKQIVLTGSETVRIISFREIVWGKASLGRSEFRFLNHDPFHSLYPLRKYEILLQSKGFFRCHSHYLINPMHINYVDSIELVVNMINGDFLPLDPKKCDSLMNSFHAEEIMIKE